MAIYLKNNSLEPQRIYGYYCDWVNPELSIHLRSPLEEAVLAFSSLKTTKDVAHLLEIPVGQLRFILNSKTLYTSFEIEKKSGGFRKISAPCNSLKILQLKLKAIIERYYRAKKSAHGFIRERSIVTNAKEHRKKNFVLNIDLENFFTAVHFGRVLGIFMAKPFNIEREAAITLAKLCTNDGCLPQGAPTSPILSNLASAALDRSLIRLAGNFRLTYTRYGDDITFSSNSSMSSCLVEEIEESGSKKYIVGKVLENEIIKSGFTVNKNKVRMQNKFQKQVVTGLVVNKYVNIDRRFIKKTRAMLHHWEIKGLAEAEKKYLMEQGIDTSNRDINGKLFREVIYGRLSFIKMVRGKNFSSYLKLCKKLITIDNQQSKYILSLREELEMYDIFICHASEDKEEVAIPLYEKLQERGIKAFIDSKQIKWGDNLINKINAGLAKSKYVIAIISKASVEKEWPMAELNSVLSSEIKKENTKLLPLIVDQGVLEKMPLLASKMYLKYDKKDDFKEVLDQLDGILS